ncbi:MAG: phosphate ABC transporter substrate-binding protein PstS [Thermoanaerobaculales bacterium]
MRRVNHIILFLTVALAAVGAGTATAQQRSLAGAGATFPYPIYARWAEAYNKLTGLQLNYQSIGSGGGIAQIKAGTVDFGASDAPQTKEMLDANGLSQWPMVIGGVVPVVNVPGLNPGALKLDGAVLADIFLGKIAKWNDPALVALNPGLALPGSAISVVHRADGSGTTWIFTNYLDKVSPAWHTKVGTSTAVEWPTGVGGKGNEGVAAYVQRIGGAIGYVEYAYALQNKMTYTLLKNRAGNFVAPTAETFQAAAAGADWAKAPGFYLVLTDQAGEKSWPISGATFILAHKQQVDFAKARDMLKFFDWCLHSGQAMAEELVYVPLPGPVVELVEAHWRKEITADNQPIWK